MSHEESKWKGFENPARYHIEDLGRPAIFLIPKKKLDLKVVWPSSSVNGGSYTADCRWFIEKFLAEHFGAFTVTEAPVFGIWNNGKMTAHDTCAQYEVSFVGKEKVPMIMQMLAFVAKQIGEESIYFKAGQYACLVYPPKRKPRLKKK